MRKITIVFMLFCLCVISHNMNAQAPEKFNYQAILRNSTGELVKDQEVTIQISIIEGSVAGTTIYREQHIKTTNDFGMFDLLIGNGTSNIGTFALINWGASTKYLKIETNTGGGFVDMGTVQLLSVPFSLYSNKAKILDNTALYFTDSDTLFAVKDHDGNIVFAVFTDGAKVYVNEVTKGKVGGFAVSGRSPTKLGVELEYLHVTPDSTRIYVNDTVSSKGKVGGFAVSGRSPTKGTSNDYLFVTGDSTRIYVNDSLSTKGKVGGFAVSGRSPTKGEPTKFMDLTKENYFIGHKSGNKNISGLYNSFVGYESGSNNKDGGNNVFLGFRSGYLNSGGNNNTFLGHVAGYSNSTGSNNVFLGDSAGFNNDSGEQNIFLGNATGKTNTIGNYNAFIGYYAGQNNLSGKNNAFIGYEAGYMNETGNNNSFIGHAAGWWTYKGSKNVFIGYKSGYLNYGTQEGTVFGGNNNIYIGDSTGYKNRTGYNNVFIGTNAGAGSTDYTISKSVFNVYIGYRAGYKDYEGDKNVCIGYQAGYENKSADYQVYIGESAGFSHTSGNDNLFIGYGSGILNQSGAYNVFVGPNTGINNIAGSGNLFIGNQAGRYETGSNKLFVDNQDRTSEAQSRTNSLMYGEFNVTTSSQVLRINGKIGVLLVTNPTEALEVNGNVKATAFIATTTSTGAYKYNTTLNMTVPDYVFDKYIDGNLKYNPTYDMLSLSDLRKYISDNRHLPRVPSRKEIEKDGVINLQGLSMITLEKVEENTLYILELEKITSDQKLLLQQQTAEIDGLKSMNKENERRINDLERIVLKTIEPK